MTSLHGGLSFNPLLSSFSVIDWCTECMCTLFPEHCLALLGPSEVLMPRLSSSSSLAPQKALPTIQAAAAVKQLLVLEGPRQLLSSSSWSQLTKLSLPPRFLPTDSSSSFPVAFLICLQTNILTQPTAARMLLLAKIIFY